MQSEVPIRIPTRGIVFLGLGAELPGVPNEAGQLVVALRNHFHWRSVWESEVWEAELRSLVTRMDALLNTSATGDGSEISAREKQSLALLQALDGQSRSGTLPVRDEVLGLLQNGNVPRAREVIDRWLAADVVRPDEALELQRLSVLTYLGEAKPIEALAQVESVLNDPSHTPEDIALGARCALECKDPQRAATLMHLALDRQVAPADVKALALRIAGAAGDSRLTKRVLT
jgi:hypothetical protein